MSNFRILGGADPDSVFYSENAGAGGVGLIDGSTDLGNRYTDKATLNYNVGLYGNSGSDLGYLRGNLGEPVNTGVSAIWNTTYSTVDSNGQHTIRGNATVTATSTFGQTLTVYAKVSKLVGSATGCFYEFTVNGTTYTSNAWDTEVAIYSGDPGTSAVLSFSGSCTSYYYGAVTDTYTLTIRTVWSNSISTSASLTATAEMYNLDD